MKKIIGVFLLTILLTVNALAQNDRTEMDERMRAFRVAYITDKLALTPDESQNFWPLYNEFELEGKKLREGFKRPKNVEELSDAEIEKLMNQHFEMEEQKLALKRQYFTKFKQVLPTRKVAKLIQVEREFKKKLLKKLNQKKARQKGKSF